MVLVAGPGRRWRVVPIAGLERSPAVHRGGGRTPNLPSGPARFNARGFPRGAPAGRPGRLFLAPMGRQKRGVRAPPAIDQPSAAWLGVNGLVTRARDSGG